MKYFEKEKMRSVAVEEAVGKVLTHDITRIVPDLFKGPEFKKGHVIQVSDVARLLDLGKKHIYVTGLDGEIHENEAALRMARAAAGRHITISDPSEGKVTFTAMVQGVLKIDIEGLAALNRIDDIMFASLHTNQVVDPGQDLAGTRIIPLSIEAEKLEQAESVLEKYFPLITVKPMIPVPVGVVVTGSEIYSGRIRDRFGPKVASKFDHLGSKVMDTVLVADEMEMTVAAIQNFITEGVGMIAVTGGMSVDPDDLTPAAIRAAGGEVVFYGAPVLPGAMFMLAYIQDVPVVGLPGCVMYHGASIFDLIVPRLLAGDRVTKSDIALMGHGGFCSGCDTCRFPNCSFGKTAI